MNDIAAPACPRHHPAEALALLTNWLFEHAAAEAAEASTDPANVAMRTVFQRVGWMPAGSLAEFGREWIMYRITRREWEAHSDPDGSRTPRRRTADHGHV